MRINDTVINLGLGKAYQGHITNFNYINKDFEYATGLLMLDMKIDTNLSMSGVAFRFASARVYNNIISPKLGNRRKLRL